MCELMQRRRGAAAAQLIKLLDHDALHDAWHYADNTCVTV